MYKLIDKEVHTTEVYVIFYNKMCSASFMEGKQFHWKVTLGGTDRWYPFIHLDVEL